jgi:hypothetical protein
VPRRKPVASQLVVVDLTGGARPINFTELTREPLDMIMFYVQAPSTEFHVHQYSYNRQYSDWNKLEVVIFWDKVDREQRPLGYTPTALEQAILRLCRQYEIALNGTMTVVTHNGYLTTAEFKQPSEPTPVPLNLDWLEAEPTLRGIV